MTYPTHGRTWWGKAWVEALTARARLDPDRLIHGRAYVRGNRVHDLVITPGAVGALVSGGGPRPYSVIINVPVLDAAGWARVFEAMSAQVGHVAALLAGDLAPGVGAELDLLPGAGDLRCVCSCPDQAELCKHAAAVCYLTADLLDADPFAVLLLRGRMRDEVLDALRDRRQSAWTPPSGMLAREAFLRPVAPLPPPAPPPAQPGVPVPLRAAPPAAAGVTSAEIARLAADAAARAWELLGAAVTAGDVLLGTLGGVDPAAEGLVVDAEFSADLTQ